MTDSGIPAERWQDEKRIPKADSRVILDYNENKLWGMSMSLDIKGCDPELMRNPYFVRDFARDLVKYIDMEGHGPPHVERFGHGDKTGITLVQLIETSSITAHFTEDGGMAYLDIFSCKPYPPKLTAEFCKRYFRGESYTSEVVYRH